MGPENNWKILPLVSDLNETRSGGGDNSVFQVVPKFAVEREFAVPFEKSRKVNAITRGKSVVCLAVETELLIFDSELDVVTQTIPFGSSIDFIIWSEQLLIVGLSSSVIVFLHPVTFEQLEARTSDPDAEAVVKRNTQNKFYAGGSLHVDGSVCLLQALSVEGRMFRFTTPVASDNTLDYTQLDKSIAVETAMVMEYVMPLVTSGQLITSCIFPSSQFLITAELTGALTILDTGFPSFEGTATTDEFHYRLNNRVNLIKDLSLKSRDVFIKKMATAEGLLFVLLSSGTLEILLDMELFPTPRLHLPVASARVHDFALVVPDRNIRLWVIFGDLENPDENYVGVFVGTKFEPSLIMRLPLTASAEQDVSGGLETVQELKFNQDFTNDRPTVVVSASCGKTKVFHLTESSTESTLEQLLTHRKFEQANAFAEKYSIDVDLVRKAKVEALYSDLEGISEAKRGSTFNLLIHTLEEITDANFVTEFCSRESTDNFSSIDWIKQVFGVGLKKVSQVSETEHAQKLLLLTKKFHTFTNVYPEGSVRKWQEFCNPNHSMFQVCREFLFNKQFGKCNYVWRRHSDEFTSSLTLGEFVEYFWALFCDQLATSDSVALFNTILPDALQLFVQPDFNKEHGLTGVVGLIQKQIGFLEMQLGWPSNAMRFVEALDKIHRKEAASIKDSSIEPGCEREVEVKLEVCQYVISQLESLQQALKELSELINSYALRIKFSDFFQDDLEQVVNSMLDELFRQDEVVRFVQKFLRPFAERKQLNIDELFSNHIKSKVGDLIYFQNITCIPYEERLVCLVGLISDLKTKFSCALLIVQNLPVPWSSYIETFVGNILTTTVGPGEDPECEVLLNAIAGARKQVPFQCLLMKYQLAATAMQRKAGVWMAIRRILASDRYSEGEKLADCKELVKFTGRIDYDGVLTMKFYQALDADESDAPTEDLIPPGLSESAMTRMRDRCLIVFPECFKMPKLYSARRIQRYLEAAEILSRRLNSEVELEFLQVRKIVPGFERISAMFNPAYPLSVLEQMIETLLASSTDEIKTHAQRLSSICLHPYHDIVVAVTFLIMERVATREAPNEKVWELLREVVGIPGCVIRAPELQDLVMWGIPILIFENPTLSCEQQTVLEEFIKIVACSFDDCPYRVSQFISVHRTFMTLRNKEIPLENEFRSLITDLIGFMTVDTKPIERLKEELKTLIVGLIKHGDHELIVGIVNFLSLHHGTVKVRVAKLDESSVIYCDEVLAHLELVNVGLKETIQSNTETETDPRIRELVEALNRAGVYVNSYAVRHRNKTKLINDLLGKQEHRLAAEVALIFHHRDKEQWSRILREFINDGNVAKLKSLLKTLKNITELWVVPEFATAWLKVSEQQPDFKVMCPIPLL